jgi:hypothetical protein
LGGSVGSSGAITSHNASGTSGFAISEVYQGTRFC